MTEHWSKRIPRSACSDAVGWAATQPTIKAAWESCERGDWMLWLLAQNVKQDSAHHKRIVLAACECARLSLKYVPKGEKRPLKAIQAAEKWAHGKATRQEVHAAAAAAYAANAADAAYATANAAAYAAYAADAAANAAYAARVKTWKKCADIVRKHFTVRDACRILRKGGSND